VVYTETQARFGKGSENFFVGQSIVRSDPKNNISVGVLIRSNAEEGRTLFLLLKVEGGRRKKCT
jgi:hypothetical protein